LWRAQIADNRGKKLSGHSTNGFVASCFLPWKTCIAVWQIAAGWKIALPLLDSDGRGEETSQRFSSKPFLQFIEKTVRLMLKKAIRVLVAMSHPDDAEILVGGTLVHLKSLGCEIGIITMTSGDCGSATHTREEISRIRYAEAKAAADYLGAWYECAGLMDVEIFANAENQRRVVELMRRFDPDVVITHSPVDYMVDHEETSRLARGAAFALSMPLYQTRIIVPAPATSKTPALYYADPVEGIDLAGERLWPQFYVDISSTIERKTEALSHHESQREWLRAHHGVDEYLNRMAEWAAQYGQECGCAFAEGFRQHLGHGYPHEPVLQQALGSRIKQRTKESFMLWHDSQKQ
jgi:LmbE family N-acetylglucosaminyl deacetylase